MRTNIEIDDTLMRDVMQAIGARTKREAVETSMRAQLRLVRQQEFFEHQGKLDWQGDPEVLRRD